MRRGLIVLGSLAALMGMTDPYAQEDRNPPVTVEDTAILERARELLSDESRWNRRDTRDCPSDAKTLSLFCALHNASVEILGEHDHRRAALQEVRFAIETVSGGREFEHRLMDFNNLPETSLADVHKVLKLATERVRMRLSGAPGLGTIVRVLPGGRECLVAERTVTCSDIGRHLTALVGLEPSKPVSVVMLDGDAVTPEQLNAVVRTAKAAGYKNTATVKIGFITQRPPRGGGT